MNASRIKKTANCLSALVLACITVLAVGTTCTDNAGTGGSTTLVTYTGTGCSLPYPIIGEFEDYSVTWPSFGTMVLSEHGGTGYYGGNANGGAAACTCGPHNGQGNLRFSYTLLPGQDAWFYQAFQGTYTMASESVSGEDDWWKGTILADDTYKTILTSATEYDHLSLWAHFFDITRSKINGVTVYFSIFYADENGIPVQGPRQCEWLSPKAAWYPPEEEYPTGEYEHFIISLDSPVDKSKLLGWMIEASQPRNSASSIKLDSMEFE